MEFLPIIYLVYMFLSIYFLSFFLLLYKRNKKYLFSYPKAKRKYSVSVLVPAFNEEDTVESTIKAIFDVDYPLNELIVLNDGSTDNTEKVVRMLLKKYPKLKLVNKDNSGKADSLNVGLKMAEGELVVVVDADSYPARDSLKKMVGFFDNPEVGAATPVIVPRNRNNFFERLQVIEYNVIAFTRKLLDYVDAIYVTPGPLAVYRKSALEEIGGFDPKNLTEDIEVTWHLTYKRYQRRMCLQTEVSTTVPKKFRVWYRQRRRWNTGGLQCISKYKIHFLKRGMLGMFILPFFIMQLFLGLLGLSIFIYLLLSKIIRNYIFVRYSIPVGTPLITISDIYITPSFLNYLGVILFVAGAVFTLLVLYVMKDEILKRQNIFNILVYLLFYLSVYPIIMINALYHFFRGKRKWR